MPPELHDLIARWHEQQSQGKYLSMADLCADCPEQLPELQRHIEAVQAMEAFLGLGEAAASASLPPWDRTEQSPEHNDRPARSGT